MRLHITPFTVHKRFALTISRGTVAQTTNLWLVIDHDGVEGWGEAAPINLGKTIGQIPGKTISPNQTKPQTPEQLHQTLEDLVPILQPFSPWQHQAIHQALRSHPVPSGARAAIDMALHDWLGKWVQRPLWQLWGLDLEQIQPFSVTIGINTPAAAQAHFHSWQQTVAAQVIKVKLGSPAGLGADRAMLEALKQIAPPDTRFLVDANGGWTLAEAIEMGTWLQDQGVEYIEQPLAMGQEADLPQLRAACPLPIFVDESCWTSEDIPALADRVDGINIKLLKAGGLTEARRMIALARAHGLQVMLGCYSESDLANTAAAHLSPLADYLDLDSHLNLLDSPFQGAKVEEGRLLPPHLPGLGVSSC
jgi:L-alanine-DL-glutamate epimerase-like enolase superfamily enzyme